jgi:hypothetical protein
MKKIFFIISLSLLLLFSLNAEAPQVNEESLIRKMIMCGAGVKVMKLQITGVLFRFRFLD